MNELIVIALSTVITCLSVIYMCQVLVTFFQFWDGCIETKKELLLRLIPFIFLQPFIKELNNKLKELS